MNSELAKNFDVLRKYTKKGLFRKLKRLSYAAQGGSCGSGHNPGLSTVSLHPKESVIRK